MSLMDSFSQKERFIWHNDAFTIIVPNGTRTAYHPRASLSYLKSLLIPQVRLTRAGNVSQYQPPPPAEQPYDFYLAQLVHYGLDFHFKTEAAQRALEIEIRLERLRVPQGLLKLEKELRKECERGVRNAAVEAARSPARQQRSSNLYAVASVKTSKHASTDNTIRRFPPLDSEQPRKRKTQKCISNESDAHSSIQEFLNDSAVKSNENSDSSEESDAVKVTADTRDSASTNRSDSSPSDVIEVKRSESTSCSDSSGGGTSEEVEISAHSGNDEYPEKVEIDKDSSNDDPFVNRHDFKRVKLEKAGEHDDFIFRSAHEAAPSVARKQPPPPRVKVRRIASHPQTTSPRVNSPPTDSLDHSGAHADPFPSSKSPARRPFVNPDKRPSWTIPVRSPSAQNDTPKSVTFSQVQRETPTKAPAAEKAIFSAALKTPQGSPHRRTPSSSSHNSQIAPLRSILKKTDASLNQPAVTGDSKRVDISVEIPRREDSDAFRKRRRRRKRKSDADPGLAMNLDGVYDAFDVVGNTHDEKPFIMSDVVSGKPISQKNNILVQRSQPCSHCDVGTPGIEGGLRVTKLNGYPQQQGLEKVKGQNRADDQGGNIAQAAKLGVKNKDRRNAFVPAHLSHVDTSAKRNFKVGAGLAKVGYGNRQQMGNRSRGSLVRAGQVY